jgi:hypothetical protein
VKRLLSMVLLMIGTMSPGRGTTAFFSNATTTSANVFSAATVQVGGAAVTQLVTFSGLYPGATVYGTVTVQNGGTATLRYSVSTTTATDTALGQALQAYVRTDASNVATNCTDAGFTLIGASDLYAGNLGGLAGASQNLVGDAADSSNAGNRVLGPGASDTTLCFKIELPLTASNTLQNKTVDVTFAFTGVQKSGL